MRSQLCLALTLVFAHSLAFSQEVQSHKFSTVVADMPQQLGAGTFNQSSFLASLEEAVVDPDLNFENLNPLLEADLRNPDVRVRRFAGLTVLQLATRRANSLEGLRPMLPAIISAVDDTDRGVQLGSILTLAGLSPSIPDSAVEQLRSEFKAADVNHEKYAILAGALSKLRPNDSDTDAVIIAFIRNPKLSDAIKGQTLHELGSPKLSDSITSEIAQVLRSTASEQVRLDALLASENVGPRALNLEKDSLTAIQSDKTTSPAFRGEASNALGILSKE